jgi:hypothetical protein
MQLGSKLVNIHIKKWGRVGRKRDVERRTKMTDQKIF